MIADLCQKIHLPEEETQLALRTLKKHGVLCEKLAHRTYKKGKVGVLKKMTAINKQQGGAVSLAVVLLMAELARLEYQKRGIPMEIYFATMEDITIWCQKFRNQFGIAGLDETNWLIHHMQLRLFRLGRLQFMRWHADVPLMMPKAQVKALPLRRKEACVDVHIPQGEALTREVCIAAFRHADEFFSAYFPEMNYRYYTCFSWLLSPYNREFMKPDSNIVRFMELWHVPYDRVDPSQAIEHIFGREQIAKREFQEGTTLQRSAKARLLAGLPLGEGWGYREART